MTLFQFKEALGQISDIRFQLPNGEALPAHVHITEVGKINKHFIDCGGTIRKEQKVSFQLWESVDTWHRLTPHKLLLILELSEQKVGVGNHEIEVEYQGQTISKYGLDFNGTQFILTTQQTACLAQDQCGIPVEKTKTQLADLSNTSATSCCTPGGGCC